MLCQVVKLQTSAYNMSDTTLAGQPALLTLLICLCWDVQASGDANASLIPAKHPETTLDVSAQAKKRPLIQELS